MKIIVGCESSGRVREAFRAKGHEAYSCDILPAEDESKWHLQCDIREVLYEKWDMGIFFPPCDHLAVSGARWFEEKRRDGRQQAGIDFFKLFTELEIHYTCIENPIGIMSRNYRKPDQIIQPWWYGDRTTKSTCLWLKNLPLLPCEHPELEPKTPAEKKAYATIWREAPGPHRKANRSRTFQGIANAFGKYWWNLPLP